jgi:hypothetical protein
MSIAWLLKEVIAILADDAFILERPVAGDSAGH